MRSHRLPEMKNPGAFDRLRVLSRQRRWAQRAAGILLVLNLIALGVLILQDESGRYWFGG